MSAALGSKKSAPRKDTFYKLKIHEETQSSLAGQVRQPPTMPESNISPQSATKNLATEAEYKEKHGVWDPMPELTITSPSVHYRVDSNTFTMGIPMPESTLSPSQGQIRALGGRYDNPTPTRFLAPIDFLKILTLGSY